MDPSSAFYQTEPVTIGGENSGIFISFTDGEEGYDNPINFVGPSNGLWATVTANNKIQFSLDRTPFMGVGPDPNAIFKQDRLLVTIQDASNPSKNVTIDLNVNSENALPNDINKN